MLQRFEAFTAAISGIYRDIQKIERDEMEKYGLKGAYAQYLLALSHCPEGLSAAELCEVCDKDKAAVSRVLRLTVDQGIDRGVADMVRRFEVRLADAQGNRVLHRGGQVEKPADSAGRNVRDPPVQEFVVVHGEITSLRSVSAPSKITPSSL